MNYGQTPVSQTHKKLKFCIGQYMVNFCKQLPFCTERFPSTTCSICNSTVSETWLHVPLVCKHQHTHSLIVQRHNAVVQEIRNLLLLATKSRCLIFMNVDTFNTNHLKIQSLPGYFLVLVIRKDAIVMLD